MPRCSGKARGGPGRHELPDTSQGHRGPGGCETHAAGQPEPHSLPDIYYIILDGYARGDLLQELHQYDNTGFLSDLTDMGFYVAEDSRANYCWTLLSLASSLNATYLAGEASTGGAGTLDKGVPSEMINDSRAAALLRSLGYRITAFVKNVFDQDYADLIYAQAQELLPHGYIHGVPKYAERTAGLALRYDF